MRILNDTVLFPRCQWIVGGVLRCYFTVALAQNLVVLVGGRFETVDEDRLYRFVLTINFYYALASTYPITTVNENTLKILFPHKCYGCRLYLLYLLF